MDTCMYCEKDERLNALMVPVFAFEHATLYLYRENTYPGRCVLVPQRHEQHLTDLSDEERNDFFACAMKAARAIEQSFAPTQINYLFFGDGLPHLHMHMVPKYQGGADFGSFFRMMPEDGHVMNDEECARVADRLRERLTSQE